MSNIKQYLYKHIFSVIIVIILLAVQCFSFIMVPFSIGEVLETGIKSYGYDAGAPEVVTKEMFESKISNLTEEQQNFVKDKYTLLDKTKINEEEYNVYKQKYANMQEHTLYKKNWTGDKKISKELDSTFRFTTEEILSEYKTIGVDIEGNKKIFISEKLWIIAISSIICCLTYIINSFVLSRLTSTIGYDIRRDIVKNQLDIGLTDSFEIQNLFEKLSKRVYFTMLVIGLLIYLPMSIYFTGEYGVITRATKISWILGIIVFLGSFPNGRRYVKIPLFALKILILAFLATQLQLKMFAILGLLFFIIWLVNHYTSKWIDDKINTIVSAHEDNIENIGGQIRFVLENDNGDTEVLEKKKQVKKYLSHNEYLFTSSWMLEFFDGLSKFDTVVTNYIGYFVALLMYIYISSIYNINDLLSIPILLLFTF